jgi:4-amino-4-deoxy-L-arabinose transferase-like glycosyltransferase
MPRAAGFVALLLGAILRLYPLHRPFIHPDQEIHPRAALVMLQKGDWHPSFLVYPSGFTYALRVAYEGMLVWGTSVSRNITDATDLFWRFIDDPMPFFFVARLLSAVAGIATIALTWSLGDRIGGRAVGPAAALIVAVAFLAVRESHYGSIDASASMLLVAALVASTSIVETGSARSIVAAAVLAGLAAATRYQNGVVALAIPAALVLSRRPIRWFSRVAWLGLATAVAFCTFAIVTPYTLLEFDRARVEIGRQLSISYLGPGGLSPDELLPLAVGWPVCVLAAIGVAAIARRRPATLAVVLIVAVPYAVMIGLSRAFARYALPLVPVVAALAAAGAWGVGGLAPARRSLVAALVVVAASLGPCARSVALVRLLAVPDTRRTARAWLLAHVQPREHIWLPSPFGYANPTPMLLEDLALGVEPDVIEALRARRPQWPGPFRFILGVAPSNLASLRAVGGLFVVLDHPVLEGFASTPKPLVEFVHRYGTLVAQFTGLDDEAAQSTRFELIDANFVPYAGIGYVRAPGPNIEIWRVPPSAPKVPAD